MTNLRSKLVTVAAVGAAALGGAALAGAATNGSGSSSSSSGSSTQAAPGNNQPPRGFDPSKGGHSANGKTEKLLTGDVAAKVKAAALAKVSGTVERVETNVDSNAPYEAHIRKADGTGVEVQVNSDYTVAAVNTMGGHP